MSEAPPLGDLPLDFMKQAEAAEAAKPEAEPSPAAAEDRVASLAQSLLAMAEDAAQPATASVAATESPTPAQAAEQSIVEQPSGLIPDDLLAQAARLNVPAEDLFRRDPQELPAFLASVERFHAHQQAVRQQAAQPPAQPQFDYQARVADYVAKGWDEQVAADTAAKDQQLFQLNQKFAQLENAVRYTYQQQAQGQAAAAVAQWNDAIANALASGPPQLAAFASDPAALNAIQLRSQQYAQMLTATGQPIPGADELARQAAFQVYGTQLIATSQPSTPYASTTPRPRGQATPPAIGKPAALAHITSILNRR